MKQSLALISLCAMMIFAAASPAAAQAADPAPEGYSFIATFTVKPGTEDRFVELMYETGKEVLREPGCIDWKIFRSPTDPTVFIAWEIFRDERAFREEHLKLPHVAKANKVFAEILAKPVEVQRLKPFRSVSTK